MDRNYFKPVIGYKSIKKELQRIVDQLISPDKYANFGIKEPHGLLLHGVPGVGKTTEEIVNRKSSSTNIKLCVKGWMQDGRQRVYGF